VAFNILHLPKFLLLDVTIFVILCFMRINSRIDGHGHIDCAVNAYMYVYLYIMGSVMPVTYFYFWNKLYISAIVAS